MAPGRWAAVEDKGVDVVRVRVEDKAAVGDRVRAVAAECKAISRALAPAVIVFAPTVVKRPSMFKARLVIPLVAPNAALR